MRWNRTGTTMLELLLLLHGIAFATIGVTGYAIFGPLTCRHLKDRGLGREMDESALSPTGLRWILTAGYRRHAADPGLRQLAVPARIMLLLTMLGLTLIGLRLLLG